MNFNSSHRTLTSFGIEKMALILAFSALFLLTVNGRAMADYSNPHGNYTANTEACAQCHRTHTATSPNLIAFTINGDQNYIYRTCIFCHDGTGSKYDEVDGQILAGNYKWPTPGGGFQYSGTIGGDSSYAAKAPVTSKHIVDGAEGAAFYIPGAVDDNVKNQNGTMQLTCVSCHDPHGTTNSRLLVSSVNVMDPSGTTWQTISTTSDTVNAVTTDITIQVTADAATSRETVTYTNAISNFCGACHRDYLQTTTALAGAYSQAYRHSVAKNDSGSSLPPSQSNSSFVSSNFVLPTSNTGDITCMTCHFAHGTTAEVSTSTYDPPDPVKPATLLRMDERGVCQNCHNNLFPDISNPTVLPAPDSYVADPTHVVLTFSTYVNGSSYLNEKSAQNVNNYTINNNSVVSASLQPNGVFGKQVVLQLASPITTGSTITVSNIQDLNGNSIAATGNTFSY